MPIFDETKFLNAEGLRYATVLAEQERITPLTAERMFKGGIYVILAAKETYSRQMKIYNELLRNGLDSPSAILHDCDLVNRIAGISMRKPGYLRDFAEWWTESDWKDRLILDIASGGVNWYALRNELADNAGGLGYKGASLLMEMSGSEEVVVADTWLIKYLLHHRLIDERLRLNRGLSKREYLPIEEIVRERAKIYETPPAIFRRALWVKNSNWKQTKASIDQIVLAI